MPDGQSLLSIDEANGCCVWEVATGKSLPSLARPDGKRFYLAGAFSRDVGLVAMGSNSALGVWDTKTGKLLWKAILRARRSAGGHFWLASLAFSADADIVACRGWTYTDVELRRQNRQNHGTSPSTKVPLESAGNASSIRIRTAQLFHRMGN